MLAPVTPSKDCHDPAEELAALLHGDEGVFEGGRRGVVGDDLDFGLLLSHAGLEGGLVVGVFNLVEGRCVKREGARRVEGIAGTEVGCSGESRV